MPKATAPYGTWPSPIEPETITSDTNLIFDDVLVDSATKNIYYLQEDPGTGHCLVMKPTKPTPTSILPHKYSARTLVQEYGGAAAIVHENIVYFSYYNGNPSDPDNRIYKFKIGDKDATPVTPKNPLYRYANFAIHPTKSNLLVALREDHTNDPHGDHPDKVVNIICVVDTEAKTVNDKFIYGAGFYASPAFDETGTKIAWQEWNLPYMPWQAGLVKCADVSIDSGTLAIKNEVLVAGDPITGEISAAFPRWIPNTSKLAYISDRGESRFQNPYIYDTVTKASTLALKTELSQDFCEPEWYLGLHPYTILGGGKYGAFTAFKDGRNILYIINLTAPSDPVSIPWTPFDFTVAQHVRTVSDNSFVFTGSQSAAPGGIVLGTVSDNSGYTVAFEVLEHSGNPPASLLEYVSKPVPMTLESSDPDKHPIYVVRYDPQNPKYTGPEGKYPPCIIGVHGGPTGLEPQALNWTKMFFTSRGFTWVDVNYRGSSGYGRKYCDLLYGHWGRYDVQDCHEAATKLGEGLKPYIDVNRVAIRGGSAGAYTSLASLTFAPSPIPTFYKSACGAYGCVADVEALEAVSEKFELKYTDTLFGCPPTNHAWDPWNPIKHAGNIKAPLLLLQGLADGVVQPGMLRSFIAQSAMAAPSQEFAFYPNEGHHFVQGIHIRNALSREFHWYLDTLLQPEPTPSV